MIGMGVSLKIGRRMTYTGVSNTSRYSLKSQVFPYEETKTLCEIEDDCL